MVQLYGNFLSDTLNILGVFSILEGKNAVMKNVFVLKADSRRDMVFMN